MVAALEYQPPPVGRGANEFGFLDQALEAAVTALEVKAFPFLAFAPFLPDAGSFGTVDDWLELEVWDWPNRLRDGPAIRTAGADDERNQVGAVRMARQMAGIQIEDVVAIRRYREATEEEDGGSGRVRK